MVQNPENKPQFIDIKEFAAMLKVSERTIHRRIAAKAVPPPIYFVRLVRWDLAVVKRWMANGCPPCDQDYKQAS